MMTKKGPQCDGCDKMVQREDMAKGATEFLIPPNGSFGGIAKKSDPNSPVRMIACPSCWPKILYAIKAKSVGGLPAGRFKRVMTQLILMVGVQNFNLKLREGHA